MNLLPAIFRREAEPAPDAKAPEVVRTPMSQRVRRAVRNLSALLSASDTGRLSGDWPTWPVPAEWIIRQHQRIVVARSREQCFNNDYARAYLRICRQNIVGHNGILYNAQARKGDGKLDADANAAIEEWWKDWGRRQNCDVAGRLSWRQIQEAVVTSLARDGEFMIRVVTGKTAGKYGFQLQLLDPQRCPPDFDRTDLPGGNFIRSGIEFTPEGKRVAYYFQQPNERDAWNAYNYAGRSYMRIPAEEIIHDFVNDMVGQKRGLPWLLTALWRMRQMTAFEDAAIVNARAGAAKMGFVKWDADSDGPDYDADEDDLQIDMEAGAIPVLPKGASVDKFDPGYPSGEFAVFMKQMLRSMSAGGGVMYPTLANDLEGVNFSSIRQGALDERDNWKTLQQFLTESLCMPVIELALPRALLAGHIRVKGKPLAATKVDELSRGEWLGRRWQWVDPTADVKAAVDMKNNLLTAPSDPIRELGEDPQGVWRRIANDIAEMRAAGIPDEFIKLAMGQKPEPPKPDKPAGSD